MLFLYVLSLFLYKKNILAFIKIHFELLSYFLYFMAAGKQACGNNSKASLTLSFYLIALTNYTLCPTPC